jgi:formamidopyrimidine-DNA glycosylase
MPELPDVEAVIKRITGRVRKRTITGITVLDKILVTESRLKPVVGKTITGVSRRGKYILFSLSGDYTLVVHLRMTGDLLSERGQKKTPSATRLIIRLNGGRELRFVDQRRLGRIYLVRDRDFRTIPGLEKMGPEPLEAGFSIDVFKGLLKRRRGMIKAILMDQSFIAGIGNIYSDEILFQSRIRPFRKVHELRDEEVKRLYKKTRYVLNKACEHDADLSGLDKWFVKGRSTGYCPHCSKRLDRIKIQGRYSYFCGRCQR